MTSLESINSLLLSMKPLLLEAGVPEHQLFIIPKTYKTKTLAIAFDWLHEVFMSKQFEDCIRIWKLVKPETWESYRLLEIQGLTEQTLLIEKSKPLIKLWKNKRPRLFINRQKELCQNCEEMAVFVYSHFDDIEYLKECTNCNQLWKIEK